MLPAWAGLLARPAATARSALHLYAALALALGLIFVAG